jgi:hypothetical protein
MDRCSDGGVENCHLQMDCWEMNFWKCHCMQMAYRSAIRSSKCPKNIIASDH